MANPFDQFDSAGPVYGAPPKVEPFAGEDQQFQRNSESRAATAAPLDAEGQRLTNEMKRLDLEAARKKAADPTGALGVEQAKATGFYSRAVKANQAYEKSGIGAQSLPQAIGRSVLPDFVEPYLLEPDRQASEANVRGFIAAALRYESGAAIPPEEMSNAYKQYFPQAGEGPEAVAAKARLRAQTIEGLKLGAGPGAAQVNLDSNAPPTFEQISAELKARSARGDDPAATIQWLISTGQTPTKEMIDQIIANRGNPNAAVENTYDPNARAFAEGVGGVVEGAGDVAGLLSSPFIAGVNAITGSNFETDVGKSWREGLGLPEASTPEQQFINSAGGAAMMGGGMAGAARKAAPYFGEVVGGALSRVGAAPGTDAAIAGAGGGAADVARQAGGGAGAQIAAGLAGGVAMAPVASRLASAAQRLPAVETALSRAGKEESVTVNRAMIDRDTQQKLTGVGKTLIGGKMMQGEMSNVGGQIEGRVKALGQGGQALDPTVAGQTVSGALDRSIKTSGAKARVNYDRAEKAAGGAKVPPTSSLQIIDEMLVRLGETPETNKAELAWLQSLKNDFGKDLSVGALRDIRTKLRKSIAKGDLTFGESEARVLDIMDAASNDIANGLAAQGKQGAAALFKRADQQYAERMDFIKNTVQKIVGKRGANHPPERIIANLRAMASPKGDSAGLAKVMREMTPEERADVGATFADSLGKDGDGNFSTAVLVKSLEKLPASARVAIFGPEGAKSLDNIAELAKAHKRVAGALGGSPTSLGNDWRSWLTTFFVGGGAGMLQGGGMAAAGAAAGVGIKAARDAISAKLLMSQNITKWLRQAPPTTSPKAINAHFDRLKAIAVREPALATEIEQLRQMIYRAANENVTPGVAASQPNEDNQGQ